MPSDPLVAGGLRKKGRGSKARSSGGTGGGRRAAERSYLPGMGCAFNGPVNAEITPKVQGYLLKQDYQNGYFVKKGQLMFEIDPRQYVAALDRLRRKSPSPKPTVGSDHERCPRHTAGGAERHTAEATRHRSLHQARKAQLTRQSKPGAGRTEPCMDEGYAPIDGIAGVSNAQVGDLVGTTTKMTTVSQVNPIWAYFNISESDFLSNECRA